MYLKKFLNQPNVVGTLLIALLFGGVVVFAFGFDGFNVQSVGEDDVESLLLMTASGCCGGDDDGGDDFNCTCLDDEDTTESCICDAEDHCDGTASTKDCDARCDDGRCGPDGDTGACSAKGDAYCPNNVPNDAETCGGSAPPDDDDDPGDPEICTNL